MTPQEWDYGPDSNRDLQCVSKYAVQWVTPDGIAIEYLRTMALRPWVAKFQGQSGIGYTRYEALKALAHNAKCVNDAVAAAVKGAL